MKRTLRPRLEALESKALLSGVESISASAGRAVLRGDRGAALVAASKPHDHALQTNLTTNQSAYAEGQMVVMTLTYTNNSKQSETIVVGPSIDVFSITKRGKTIWRSNHGFVPQYIARLTLQPGQSYSMVADWRATVTGELVVHNTAIPVGSTAHFRVTSP
jgi:hypothetical protein